MDPNATLTRIRQLLDDGYGSRALLGDEGFIAELTEHVQAMDDWLSRGGFLPEGWDHPGRTRSAAVPAARDCGAGWVAEIALCPRCGLSAAEHPAGSGVID